MITLAEYKSYKQINDTSQDAYISFAIPYATDIIEKYCDRVFLSQTNYEWVDLTESQDTLYLKNFPINRIIYTGLPSSCAVLTDLTDDEQVVIDSLGMYYYSNAFATPTSFLFSVYVTLADLKTSLEAATGITMTISAPTTTPSRLLLPGTNTTLLYAKKVDISFDILDTRSCVISSVSGYTSNLCYGYISRQILMVYNSGYDIANIPYALKKICMDIVNDLINVLNASGNTYQSETLGDYSYSMFDVNIAGSITSKYEKDLNVFRKLTL